MQNNAYRCQCGHLHGHDPCESVTGHDRDGAPIHCRCSRFRNGVTNQDGTRRVDQRGTAFSSPLYHLSSYGIQNPWVQWAIANGAYVDMEDRGATSQDIGDAESARVARQIGLRFDSLPRQLRR